MSTERLVGECPACLAEKITPSKGIAFVLGSYISHKMPIGVAVIFCDKHDLDWKEIEDSKKFENFVLIQESHDKGSLS